MTREEITLEVESVAARLRSLRLERPRTSPRSFHDNRLIHAQEELLIAELELLAAHRRVLDAQDVLSAIGGAR